MTPDPRRDAELDAIIGKWHGVHWLSYWSVHHPTEPRLCLIGTEQYCHEWLANHQKEFPDSEYSGWIVKEVKLPKPYATDLNAMHEAQKHLNAIQWERYADIVANSVTDGTTGDPDIRHLLGMEARQRAEALVKVIEEEKTLCV